MDSNVKIIFGFTLGVAAGVVATWKFFKTKYETISREEIDSVKEVYSKKNSPNTDNNIILTREKVEEYKEYKEMVNDLCYKNKEKGGSESMKNQKIEVIPPDEYGIEDDYDLIELIYYADGVLVDDGNYPIEDVDEIVGPEALDSFGEWEDDEVYVRNDERKCYYNILRDNSNYSDLSVNVDDDE